MRAALCACPVLAKAHHMSGVFLFFIYGMLDMYSKIGYIHSLLSNNRSFHLFQQGGASYGLRDIGVPSRGASA